MIASIKGAVNHNVDLNSYGSIRVHYNTQVPHTSDSDCLCVAVGDYTQGELAFKDEAGIMLRVSNRFVGLYFRC